MLNSKWIFCPKPQPDARLRLFCFPYAGGGSSVFFEWPDNFPSEIEICASRLPGRESRFHEEPYRRMVKLVEDLAAEIMQLLNNAFAFFGHSVGARVCFELARHFRRNNVPSPTQLLVSASRAPDVPPSYSLHHKMINREFIEQLMKIGGIPEELHKNHELLSCLVPTLRADIEMLNTYRYVEEEPLDCVITAYGGLQDQLVSREHAEAWCRHTRRDFKLHMIQGGHFFINMNQKELLKAISHDLRMEAENG